jgi:hypothetical protein
MTDTEARAYADVGSCLRQVRDRLEAAEAAERDMRAAKEAAARAARGERAYRFGSTTIRVSEKIYCHRESRHIDATFEVPREAFRAGLAVCLPRSVSEAAIDRIAAALSTFNVETMRNYPFAVHPGGCHRLSVEVDEDVSGGGDLADRVMWTLEAMAWSCGESVRSSAEIVYAQRFELCIHQDVVAVHHTRGVRIEIVRDAIGEAVDIVALDSTVLAARPVDSLVDALSLMAEAIAADDAIAAENAALAAMRERQRLAARDPQVLDARDVCYGDVLVGITVDTTDGAIAERVRELARHMETGRNWTYANVVDVESVTADLRAHRDLRRSGTDRLITRTEAARRLAEAARYMGGRATKATDITAYIAAGMLTGVSDGARTKVLESEIAAYERHGRHQAAAWPPPSRKVC